MRRSPIPWDCSECGAPGFQNVYSRGYCVSHLAELYRAFSPEVWDLAGVGLPEGRRPDHGEECFDLRCVACGATWVGAAFDPCGWCERERERLVADQRRQLLDPPWLASDAGDPRYDELSALDQAVWDRTRGQRRDADSLEIWVGRLARAVEAGVITEDEARRAVDRYDRRGMRRAG